jgi:hypothetical protein
MSIGAALWAPKKSEWARAMARYSAASSITRAELIAFHAKQRWVSSALAASTLPHEVASATGRNSTAVPVAAMYGSVVAGTAFRGGDMDFALAFPDGAPAVDPSTQSQAGFVEVPRGQQASVLGSAYAALLPAFEAGAERVAVGDVAAARGDAAAAMGRCGGHDRTVSLQRIFHARVPILQCGLFHRPAEDVERYDVLLRWDGHSTPEQVRAPSTGPSSLYSFQSEFDVSASLTGCRNSLLLRLYLERNPWVRPLAMVLKHIGRRGGPKSILNAKSGWLSPYALTVMLVHYLHDRGLLTLINTQAVEERLALLGRNPFDALVAQGKLDELTAERRKWLLSTRGSSRVVDDFAAAVDMRSPLELPDVGFDELHALNGGSDDACAAELLRGFFAFYAAFDFESNVVDIRPVEQGRLVSKEDWDAEIRAEAAAAMKKFDSVAEQEVALSIPPAHRAGEVNQGRSVVDRTLWHRLGYDVIMIRDPIETHSLGRGIDFFRAEAIREGFRRVATSRTVDPDVLLPATN